jgi:endoglucanase
MANKHKQQNDWLLDLMEADHPGQANDKTDKLDWLKITREVGITNASLSESVSHQSNSNDAFQVLKPQPQPMAADGAMAQTTHTDHHHHSSHHGFFGGLLDMLRDLGGHDNHRNLQPAVAPADVMGATAAQGDASPIQSPVQQTADHGLQPTPPIFSDAPPTIVAQPAATGDHPAPLAHVDPVATPLAMEAPVVAHPVVMEMPQQTYVPPQPVTLAPDPVVATPNVSSAPVDPPTAMPAAVGAHDGFHMGINLAGGEYGDAGGQYGTNYIYPGHDSIDYYASKGMDVVRLPFLWERVQPTMNGALDANELQRIDDFVDYANSKGMKVILDVHNYGSGFGNLIGSPGTPDSAFADLWGKLAGHYADNPNTIFGLMNEPHEQSAEQWLGSANAAIAAIRDAGATSQEILVPGTHWDGAWSWTTSDNAKVIGKGIVDPANNFAFEVHQYLDSDGSGTHADVVSTTVGAERLKEITTWAEATGNKLFLGEFGVAQDQKSLAALDQMLSFAQAHSNVWQGGTYWAGGPWWGDYKYSAEPNQGVEKAQIAVLQNHTTAGLTPMNAAATPVDATHLVDPLAQIFGTNADQVMG